jgi:hypothetical protein
MRSLFALAWLACACGTTIGGSDAGEPGDDAGSIARDAAGPDSGTRDDGGTPADPCAAVTCSEHAECIEVGGRGVCRCAAGYMGDGTTCEPTTDPCVAAGTCPDGVWIRRTLPGVAAPATVQTVLVDPVRPSDFYAFVGSNGGPMIRVYRSMDFGETWEQRSTTAELTGNPWGASIDPNPLRDPSTPPTMWTPAGYGSVGAWRSTDGGVTWTRSAGCDAAFGPYNPFGSMLTDLYHIQILPDDPPNHILATYHYGFLDNPDGGFGESWDGGETWVVHPPPVDVGTSHYVIPISGTTWAVIAQSNDGRNGIWRRTTAGRVGGTEAMSYRDGTISTSAWTRVHDLEHAHGSHQNRILGDGTILVTGWTNGAVSTDRGATWTNFTEGSWAGDHMFESSQMTNLATTDRYVYTNFLSSPTLARAPLDALVGAENWDVEYCERPEGFEVGGAPFGMASSFSAGTDRWVIVAGAYDGTIWKYVEPPP